ncbi:MAG: hypothetical protein Q8O43_10610 [Dehalococcoidia bacterium]|nr:hypothetical protein [Dehalococcoidia bacterium]
MTYVKKVKQLKNVVKESSVQLYGALSPEIAKTIDRLYSQFGKYAVPLTDLRNSLDKELGEKTLTDELLAMREGR